jgi:hypothetical protein
MLTPDFRQWHFRSLFYGGTVRFAVALGIHCSEPSEQMLKVLSSAQRRKELWYSIHVTDLWLTNACAFTVVNGPASAVPIEVSWNQLYISRHDPGHHSTSLQWTTSTI